MRNNELLPTCFRLNASNRKGVIRNINSNPFEITSKNTLHTTQSKQEHLKSTTKLSYAFDQVKQNGEFFQCRPAQQKLLNNILPPISTQQTTLAR